MLGISNVLRIVSPLYLMCSTRDVAISYQVKCPLPICPRSSCMITAPAAWGWPRRPFDARYAAAARPAGGAQLRVRAGMPSCVGPVGEVGPTGKDMAVRLLDILLRLNDGQP